MTPPSLGEILNQNFGALEDSGGENLDISRLDTTDRTTRVTLEELQAWIQTISGTDSDVQRLKERILSFEFNGDIIIDSYQSQIESLFGAIQAIPEEELSINYIVVLRYLESVESLYQNYLYEIGAAERDSEIRREGILPAELSDGRAQYEIWRTSIQDLFEATQGLNENQLIAQIENISLSRSINISDIDSHFQLLIQNIESDDERQIIQEFIDEYKRESIFYRDLERGENFSLSSIGNHLDQLAREIIDSSDGSPFIINLEGDEWEFESKREALLMIYQLKLHLDEMEPYMIPYFFDQYGSLMSSGLLIIGSMLVTIGGPLLVYYYAKNRLQDHMGRINEGLTREDITRLTSNSGTGVLDETIRGFEADGFTENEIRNLQRLAEFLRAEQTPQSGFADREMLRTNSDAYRQFARFRGVIPFLISSIYRMNNPIGQHRENGTIVKESPFRPRNIVGIIIGSYNRGPDGWGTRTQRQVFERYIERFSEFNEMITRIDDILINHGKSEEKRLQVRREIRQLFTRSITIPLIYPGQVAPFRNHTREIMRILSDNGVDTDSTHSRTLERRLQGKIDSNIKSRIEHIRTIIHYHPGITDDDERRIIRRLDWIQHDETPQRFNEDLNILLRDLDIDGLRNDSELRQLNISEDLRLSRNDLNALRLEIPTRTPNRTSIERYLAGTTEGHKGLIFLNIARIIRGESIYNRISIEQANIIAEPLRHTPIQRLGGVMETDEFRNIALPQDGRPSPGEVRTTGDTSETERPGVPEETRDTSPEVGREVVTQDTNIDINNRDHRARIERLFEFQTLTALGNRDTADLERIQSIINRGEFTTFGDLAIELSGTNNIEISTNQLTELRQAQRRFIGNTLLQIYRVELDRSGINYINDPDYNRMRDSGYDTIHGLRDLRTHIITRFPTSEVSSLINISGADSNRIIGRGGFGVYYENMRTHTFAVGATPRSFDAEIPNRITLAESLLSSIRRLRR